jgi:hypothetical protein
MLLGSDGLVLESLVAEPGGHAPDLAALPSLAEMLDTPPGLGLGLRGAWVPRTIPRWRSGS